MKPIAGMIASLMVATAVQANAGQSQSDPVPGESGNARSTIRLPAGTRAELALTAPVWARTARPGDPIYTQTDFPVAAGNRVAIPPGTFVQGTILSVLKPTRRSSRAQLQILFNKIVFADGYVIALPAGTLAVPGTKAAVGNDGTPPTAVTINIEVSPANDLLLDNGAEIEMMLAAPLVVDARGDADAIPLSRAPEPGKFKSATFCRPSPGSPGSPGTPDTVIPGSPGTPDITIPGGPGMPSTTIPGTPATPPTVIPGSPGTPGFPGTVCPAPPIIISSVPLVLIPTESRAASPVLSHSP